MVAVAAPEVVTLAALCPTATGVHASCDEVLDVIAGDGVAVEMTGTPLRRPRSRSYDAEILELLEALELRRSRGLAGDPVRTR